MNEIEKLRKRLGEAQAEVVHTQDGLGALLHSAEAERDRLGQELVCALSENIELHKEHLKSVEENLALSQEIERLRAQLSHTIGMRT